MVESMSSELSLEQLLHEIVLHLLFLLFSFWLIRSTIRRTNIFINQPEWMKNLGEPTWLGRLLEGPAGPYFFYFMGGAGIVLAGMGLIERFIILARGLGY